MVIARGGRARGPGLAAREFTKVRICEILCAAGDGRFLEMTAMALVRLRRAAQITLPREIRAAAGLGEGDYLEAIVTEAGILLTPVSVGRRAPGAAREAGIRAVVDDARPARAATRRR
jgi:AbrB family looped-hinge helix DNA binding protein